MKGCEAVKLYYPNAIILISEQGEIGTDKISTYEGCFNEESAMAQIELWAKGYGFEIQEAWIDVYETDLNENVERIDIDV